MKNNNMRELKFCYEKNLLNRPKLKGVLKAVWERSKFWKIGQTIKIFFINGTLAEQRELKQAYSEIAKYANLNFIYTTNRQESDIRVSFNKGWGSYSYLGVDALFIPKNQETMNIGWRGLDVCRHEALHSIGALHEHQNPNEGIEWDERAVIRDLSGPPNYWSEEEIRFNVLDRINKEDVEASDFDPKSVMLYYFPSSWTKNGISTNNNLNFSETDIKFMKEVYSEKDTIAPVITLKGESHITLNVGDQYIEQGAYAKDNVDGEIEVHIKSYVDTNKEGLYNVIYTATDKAGNKAEEIRTIMVQEDFDIKVFIKSLFPTRYRLTRLTETQLVHIANTLNIDASTSDLKKDTVDKINNKLNQ